MNRRVLGLLLLLPSIAGTASAQQSAQAPAATCESLSDCIAVVLAAAETRRQMPDAIEERLVTYGDAAADRLVPLLMHTDLYVREAAGMALGRLPRIDPKHLPALAHAWRHGDIINRQGRGNGWLPLPIALTGTDEALRLLWTDFQRQSRGNDQVRFALARFGDRLRPHVSAELESCAATGWSETCEGVIGLFYELSGFPRPRPPAMPQWAVDELLKLAVAQSAETRDAAVNMLAGLQHPAALAPLQQSLMQLPAEHALGRDGRWEVTGLIDRVVAYGEAAHESGPAVARFLDRRFDENLRADSALALGRLGYADAVPALLALAPELTDDWLLAYNVSESLGRLRAAAARPLLETLARQHWHRGVRNNAARALNMIDGGPFAQAGLAGDGQPYPAPRDEVGSEYLYLGDLRYAGDEASRLCSVHDDEQSVTVSQDPVGTIRWPGAGGAELNFASVDQATARRVRERISVREVRGDVMAVLPTRSGEIIAFNGGEFGGGLVHLPIRGRARELVEEQVVSAWRMGGRLYVAAGLSHLAMDRGHLYVLDPDRLEVLRTVRLPASPWRFSVSSERTVIIRTAAGHVAVREDGTLIDPETIDDCGERTAN